MPVCVLNVFCKILNNRIIKTTIAILSQTIYIAHPYLKLQSSWRKVLKKHFDDMKWSDQVWLQVSCWRISLIRPTKTCRNPWILCRNTTCRSVERAYPWIAVTWSFAATVAEWLLTKLSPSVSSPLALSEVTGGAQSGQSAICYTLLYSAIANNSVIERLPHGPKSATVPHYSAFICSVSDPALEHLQVSSKTFAFHCVYSDGLTVEVWRWCTETSFVEEFV